MGGKTPRKPLTEAERESIKKRYFGTNDNTIPKISETLNIPKNMVSKYVTDLLTQKFKK